MASATAAEAPPSVSVILVNLDGAEHLPDCLDSVRAQDYPRERLDVIVVDNGSTDGSLEMLADRYPWVRVLAQGTNTGFAPAVNTGVRAATGDCVALLNNDMRADPGWVSSLVDGYDPASGVVCVAGQILSWDGTEVDFVEGTVNFYGMGNQVAFGRRREDVEVRDGAQLLFACGGSVLVGRDVWLDVGGFDEGFFAYFEDIDLGWRLNLLGYTVRLAAGARSYHRLHGTSSRFPDHQRLFLYERNSLRMIMKNYGDGLLPRALAPAVLLTAKRAGARAALDGAPYRIGGDREPTEEVPRTALAHLHALLSICDDLDDILARRAEVQRRRCRTDAELSELFVRPFQPVPDEVSYVDVQRRLVALFDLEDVFAERRATRVVALSNSARTEAIVRALDDVATVEVRSEAAGGVDAAQTADVVVVDDAARSRALPPVAGLLVVDVGDPSAPGAPVAPVAPEVLEGADLFVCRGSEDASALAKALADRGRVAPVIVVADASDAAGWRQSAAPLRDIVRRPWQVDGGRAPWTEDARLVLDQRTRQVAELQERVAELHKVIDHQEQRLEQLRRIPGVALLMRTRQWWRRSRTSGDENG